MARANKTQETEANVEAFLAAVEPASRRADALRLAEMFEEVSGDPPRLWGPSIIGYGSYHYRYDSGHEGDMARISFSPRKNALVLYIMGGFPRHQELMDRLGTYKTGKSCLYLKALADVDEAVLIELMRESLAYMAATYPD
ncbi:hypothetical protein ACFB49_38000 [Sphingomonas sp. DBB INV C78]|uniref:DUF1801 domain-containing protein n=1 Tax=Sphingomonas sp. DBB INV C78 TaxID=3349434 RepID=UPI0036D3BA99